MFICFLTVFASHSDLDSLNKILNDELQNVHSWCNMNRLIMNADKTNCMLICTPQRRATLSGKTIELHLKNQPIECVETHKILGVMIDNNLKFDAHTDMLCAKLSQLHYLLRRIAPFLTLESKMLFYNSYVHSNLIYCICSWGICNKGNLDRVYMMQKRICRTLVNDHITKIETILWSIKVLPIYDQVNVSIACFVYKCLHDLAPASLCSIFKPGASSYSYCLRNNAINVGIPAPRTETRKRAISYVGATIWNSIAPEIRMSKNINLFKRNVASHFTSA